LIVSSLMSVSFFGIQQLLKILYVLRLGYGPEYVGIFNASGAFTWMIMSLPAAAIGDRIGLVPAMRLGGLLTLLGMVILPLTEMMPPGWQTNWPILSQLVTTTGWALFAINLIPAFMVATAEHNRNDAYALNAALRGLGTLVGTVLGGVLPDLLAVFLGQTLDDPGPYRLGLWISVLICVVGFVFLLRIRPLAQVAEVATKEEGHSPFPIWPVGLVVLHVYLVNAGWATCQSFCNPYLDTELRLSPSLIGLINGAGQALAVFAPLMGPRLALRWGNGRVLMATALVSSVILLPLGMSQNLLGAGIGRAGILGLTALWMPALQIYQMESVGRHWRSLAYGISSTAMGLSFGTISLIGGYVAARWGYPQLFLIGVVLTLVGSTIMWGALRMPAGKRGVSNA
jgi:MFS family permease